MQPLRPLASSGRTQSYHKGTFFGISYTCVAGETLLPRQDELGCCSQVCLSPAAGDNLVLGQHAAVQQEQCDGMQGHKAAADVAFSWPAVRSTASMVLWANVVWQV